jgi:hypothetical protein
MKPDTAAIGPVTEKGADLVPLPCASPGPGLDSSHRDKVREYIRAIEGGEHVAWLSKRLAGIL